MVGSGATVRDGLRHRRRWKHRGEGQPESLLAGDWDRTPINVNPIRLSNDTRSWTDRNRDLIPQLDELGPSTGYNLGTTNRFDPDLERPYANEMNVEIERQLPGNIVVAAGYFHRDRRRNIGRRNMAIPMESYTPITVTERASGREVTVYNQSAALRGKFDVLVHNAPENDTTYNGVDVTFNKRLAANWMMMGGLSVGKKYRRQDQNLNRTTPIFKIASVRMNDVPVSFKLARIYRFPYGIRVSGTFQHFTGFPKTSPCWSSSTIALTQVSQSIRRAAADNRLPDTNLLDISFKRSSGLTDAIEPGMDIFNMLNAAPITLQVGQLGTIWPPSKILAGRLASSASISVSSLAG